jgi:hypothetical protein
MATCVYASNRRGLAEKTKLGIAYKIGVTHAESTLPVRAGTRCSGVLPGSLHRLDFTLVQRSVLMVIDSRVFLEKPERYMVEFLIHLRQSCL